MTATAKIGEAMRRSLPLLPEDARQVVVMMLEPTSLAIIGATVSAWMASHLFGVGEIADIILLLAGVAALGFSVFSGARELYDFARIALDAKSDRDLDIASEHFARAVVILGVSTVQAVLLKGQSRTIIARGRPQIYQRMRLPEPPADGSRLQIARPATLPRGVLGTTDPYGAIEISRDQPLSEQQATLLHELVHRYFSPRTGPFRRIRAELSMTGYERSACLRYIEEALAEGYMEFRLRGLASALKAYRFPIDGGYVTISQLMAEGSGIGTITLGGSLFFVTISVGPIPRSP